MTTSAYDKLPEFLKDGFTVEAAIQAFERSEVTEDQVMVAVAHHRAEGTLHRRDVLDLIAAGALTDRQGGRALAIGAAPESLATLTVSEKGNVTITDVPGLPQWGLWFRLEAVHALFGETDEAQARRKQILQFCQKHEQTMITRHKAQLGQLRSDS
jgi:hypothetical protein